MRVKKSSGTLYWRTTGGSVIAETNLSGADVNEYVFFAGRRVARIISSGSVYYYQADQIGSTRTITNSTGGLCYDADFTPYGSEMSHTNTCAQNYKYAGYERDSETGLDYAMNRYYNSRMGRFMSADPSGISSASPSNPQSLHRYAYVLNNPLIGIDPFGLECVFISDDGTSIQSVEPTTEDASPGESTNDWSTGTDSASCLAGGGTYFDGNADVDPNGGNNWRANNGNFDIDLNSNWVGLTDDSGVPQEAGCNPNSTGSCGFGSLADMGTDYIELAAQGAMEAGILPNTKPALIGGPRPPPPKPGAGCKVLEGISAFGGFGLALVGDVAGAAGALVGIGVYLLCL